VHSNKTEKKTQVRGLIDNIHGFDVHVQKVKIQVGV